jgi:predicted permease
VHPPRFAFLACIIQISAPCAGLTAIFASRFGRDTALASKAVALSTLLSILTMPLFTTLAELALGGAAGL